jgi:hypothetical protein
MNQIPEEVIEQVRATVFAMYGGPERLDCWLTQIADMMATPDKVPPCSISLSMIPPEYQSWINHPYEVVDEIMDRMETFQLWRFRLEKRNGEAIVIDLHNGHVVESCPSNPFSLKSLATKYGVESRC